MFLDTASSTPLEQMQPGTAATSDQMQLAALHALALKQHILEQKVDTLIQLVSDLQKQLAPRAFRPGSRAMRAARAKQADEADAPSEPDEQEIERNTAQEIERTR